MLGRVAPRFGLATRRRSRDGGRDSRAGRVRRGRRVRFHQRIQAVRPRPDDQRHARGRGHDRGRPRPRSQGGARHRQRPGCELCPSAEDRQAPAGFNRALRVRAGQAGPRTVLRRARGLPLRRPDRQERRRDGVHRRSHHGQAVVLQPVQAQIVAAGSSGGGRDHPERQRGQLRARTSRAQVARPRVRRARPRQARANPGRGRQIARRWSQREQGTSPVRLRQEHPARRRLRGP